MGIYSASGTIEGGLGFIYTGNTEGGHFEITLPVAGGRVDGITLSSVPNDYNSAAEAADLRYPQVVQLSGNVTAGDQLACDVDGKFYARTSADEQSGVALLNGVVSGSTSVWYHSQVYPRQGTGIAKRLEPYGAICAASANVNVATLSGLPVTVGGVTVNAPGLQVLLPFQTTATERGLWQSASSGAWTQVAPVEAATSERPAVVLVSVGTLARAVCQSTDWTAAGVASTWTVSAFAMPAGQDPALLGNGDVDATELSTLNGSSGNIASRLAALETATTVFRSGVRTGTGSQETIAHGLGATPADVQAWFCGLPAGLTFLSAKEIDFGVHTGTNIVITVPDGFLYQVEASL